MKTIGFPKSHKEHEYRRVILPHEVALLSHPELLYFEDGYGENLNVSDQEYKDAGAHLVSREKCLQQDIICDPKIGDAEYLQDLEPGQTIFGWIHATQNKPIALTLIKRQLTAYAWENMNEAGRHVFWQNNQLAGKAAVIHAFECYGLLPYGLHVGVIGRGNAASGAVYILNTLGAEVVQYHKQTDRLLKAELPNYDVIVNCVKWDARRKDHLITRADLKRMKKGAMIIDVSCDRHGGIETSVPTTLEHPTYTVDGVVHYVVDHTPSIFYKTFTRINSRVIYPYLEQLSLEHPQDVLNDALITMNGEVVDKSIRQIALREKQKN